MMVTANPGRCEPGDPHRQKILPERELKGHLPSKGTGFISRYTGYSLWKENELISRVSREPRASNGEMAYAWNPGGTAEVSISSFVPELG